LRRVRSPEIARRLAVIATTLALAGCAGVADGDGVSENESDALHDAYENALGEIRRNNELPQGKWYVEHVYQETSVRYGRLARRCFVQAPDTRDLFLLYRLDAEGAPVESIAYPPSAFADCMAEGLANLADFELRPPPHPDYWFRVPAP
jgi:hypothetical protein